MDRQLYELLQRGVEAIERLSEDPVIQVETMPPVCPHCDEMNPNVSVNDTAGQGPLAEIVIKATCLNCNKEFIAMPMQMEMATTISEATEIMAERMQQRGLDGGTDQGT